MTRTESRNVLLGNDLGESQCQVGAESGTIADEVSEIIKILLLLGDENRTLMLDELRELINRYGGHV
jgi:hypothetical protein